MKSIAWVGIVVFGSLVELSLIARLRGYSSGEISSWILQEGIQSALLAVSIWGAFRVQTKSAKLNKPSGKSPRNLRNVHLAVAVILFAAVGILGDIAMSEVNDRTIKGRFTEALLWGEEVARKSQIFFAKSGRWPSQNEIDVPSFDAYQVTRNQQKGIQAISIAADGVITIVMTGNAALIGKSIRIEPVVLGRHISWRCASNYGEHGLAEYLIKHCNQQFPRELPKYVLPES
jgi:hypothetical protein